MPLFFGNYVDLSQENWLTMVTIIGVFSLSFVGIDLMIAVFPLLSPEKGQAAIGILQALLFINFCYLLRNRGVTPMAAADHNYFARYLYLTFNTIGHVGKCICYR